MIKGIILSIIATLSVVMMVEAKSQRAENRAKSENYQSSGALLYCDSMTYDFGSVDRRVENLYHTFVIENQGNEPLIITRVERSCSCMRASISKRPIAPGDSREMKVTYELQKMPPGLFSKVVQIYSNSCDTGFAQFTIQGRSVEVKK